MYRFRDFPARPFEGVIEACLWAGPDAVAGHETALAIYGLGDAMPASIHITVAAKSDSVIRSSRHTSIPTRYVRILRRGTEGRLTVAASTNPFAAPRNRR